MKTKQSIIGIFITYDKEVYHIIDVIEDQDYNPIFYIFSSNRYALTPEDGIFIPDFEGKDLFNKVNTWIKLLSFIARGEWTIKSYPIAGYIKNNNQAAFNLCWMIRMQPPSIEDQIRFILNN